MLAGISSASIQGRIALGPRAGARVWRVGEEPDSPWVLSSSPRHAHIAGFDLHANVAVPAADRARLEQLCRLLLRPPVAQDRLRRMGDDRESASLWAALRRRVFALDVVQCPLRRPAADRGGAPRGRAAAGPARAAGGS